MSLLYRDVFSKWDERNYEGFCTMLSEGLLSLVWVNPACALCFSYEQQRNTNFSPTHKYWNRGERPGLVWSDGFQRSVDLSWFVWLISGEIKHSDKSSISWKPLLNTPRWPSIMHNNNNHHSKSIIHKFVSHDLVRMKLLMWETLNDNTDREHVSHHLSWTSSNLKKNPQQHPADHQRNKPEWHEERKQKHSERTDLTSLTENGVFSIFLFVSVDFYRSHSHYMTWLDLLWDCEH